MVRRDGVRIARRCWLPADSADDFAARCAVALSTCAADTVLSSTAGARIHRLWLPDGLDDIHLASAQLERESRSMTRSQRSEFIAHRRQLDDVDRTVVNGLPVMTMARTWVDLAAVLSLPDLVAAGDSALRSGCSVAELAEAIGRSRRARGVLRAREALPLLDARSRSRPESHLRVAILGSDMPRFEVNEAVYRDEGGWLAEPDLSLAEARIALEYQGADHAEVERMRKDITREVDLRREHWRVLEYGPAEVFGRPWQILPEVRHQIALRAPHLLARRKAG
jgi:hypothetical protein